jgi:hypothetical protein
MADKATQLVLDALSRAVADPAGLPLYGNKTTPGLFASTGPAKLAAQRCKDEQFLRVVRTETRGKNAVEVCAVTDKGLSFLLGQVQPRQVLEDLVRAVEARQFQLGNLVSAAQQAHASLDALRGVAEKVLEQVVQHANGNGHASTNEAWQRFQASGVASAPRERGDTEARNTRFANATPLADNRAYEATLLSLLNQWHASGASEDCPLAELYRRSCQTHTLTIGQFHDVLRRLQERDQVYLHPWTGPLYAMPEPQVALLVGHEIAYYASIRH